jgi:hypothetical protein
MSSNSKDQRASAERDSEGNAYLEDLPWQKMEARTVSERAAEYVEKFSKKVMVREANF